MSTPAAKPLNPSDLSAYVPREAREHSAGERCPVEDAPLQPAHPNGEHEQPVTGRRDEIMTDRDLERLEASLRWLQRQESAMRLARETAPAPPLAPDDAASRHPGSERLGLRSPLSLEPKRMGPPPAGRRDHLTWLLRVLIASCVVAPVLYYFSAQGRGPASPSAPAPQLASFKPSFDARQPIAGEETGPTAAADDDAHTSVAREPSSRQANALPAGPSPAGETVAPAQPNAIETPAVSKPARVLDPDEIALLMKQGEQFVAAGDLVTARTVFRRAAEAGDATAAVALAATYDPIVLAKLGVVGIAADVEKARSWYRQAESLGSAEAARRLQILANR